MSEIYMLDQKDIKRILELKGLSEFLEDGNDVLPESCVDTTTRGLENKSEALAALQPVFEATILLINSEYGFGSIVSASMEWKKAKDGGLTKAKTHLKELIAELNLMSPNTNKNIKLKI